MVYDIVAYFNIDQEEIERFIIENNIDKGDWDQGKLISNYYKTRYLGAESSIEPSYCWNESCQIHEIYDMYCTNFLGDDERFHNRRYQMVLGKRIGRPFPECLKNIYCTLRTSEDAIEVADELSIFFSDDSSLMCFAEWLRWTAKYCSTYFLTTAISGVNRVKRL